MSHLFSGTFGVDSACTNVFIATTVLAPALRVCCPTANFSSLNDPLQPYYFFTTKKSDGTLQTTRWALRFRDDGTNKNILILPALKISSPGTHALNAGSQFSPSAAGDYQTNHYLGSLAADPNQGVYANPTDFNPVVQVGTVSIAAGACTGVGTTFTAGMVGKTLRTTPTAAAGCLITGFTDATHIAVGGAFTVTNEPWSLGGPIATSGIGGLTGGNGVGPDTFAVGYIQDWYIDVEPDSIGGDTTGGDPAGTPTADAISCAPFAHNIGKSDGVIQAVTARVATVTSYASPVITPNDHTGYATNNLAGIPLTLIRAANFTMETQIISANTTTTVSPHVFSGTAPVAGDLIVIGGIAWKVLTARLDAGMPMKKKTFKQFTLRVRDKASTFQQQVYVVAWVDGRFVHGEAGAIGNRVALNKDGVVFLNTVVRGKVVTDLGIVRYIMPFEVDGRDMQFLIFGVEADNPVELMAPMELSWSALDEVAPGAR